MALDPRFRLSLRSNKGARVLSLVDEAGFDAFVKKLPRETRTYVEAVGFRASPGRFVALPSRTGGLDRFVAVHGKRSRYFETFGALAADLPPGLFTLDVELAEADATDAAIGFGAGAYRFDRYRKPRREVATLVLPKGVDRAAVESTLSSIYLVRDLVNTPTNDLGPRELAAEARKLGRQFDARVRVIVGEKLVEEGFPLVHAVGRASAEAPRLVDMRWGRRGPEVVVVGKGVCFDSGGLDLKPASAMRLMKKDMGGAAHALGLARMIMAAKLPCRLRVLIPAVENAVSGSSFRPLDVLPSRKGKTVEIGNTDAEGRLVLADCLTAAGKPDLMIDFATLTGAARVALGTELPALFTNDDALAGELADAAARTGDVLYRLPLHRDYRSALRSDVADLNNANEGGYGGAITAALFLEEFVEPGVPWAHLDVMAWNLSSRPGRPRGGEAMGMRAAFAAIAARVGGPSRPRP
jgi:leucyl aminopeptidase